MDYQVSEGKIQEKTKIFLCVKHNKAKNWTDEEDKLLLSVAEKFKFRYWKQIANAFKNRTGRQCYERYRIIKPEIKKGLWTAEEDQALLELIKINGKKWSKISSIMKTRTGKQIRDRYYHCLDNKINNEKFTEEEHKLITSLFSKYGSAWSLISKNLPGRTSQLIKNRFYCKNNRRLSNQKRKKSTTNQKQITENQESMNENINSNFLYSENSFNSNLNNIVNNEQKNVTHSKTLKFMKQNTYQSIDRNLNKLGFRKNSHLRNKRSLVKKTNIRRKNLEDNNYCEKIYKTSSTTDEKNLSNNKLENNDNNYNDKSFKLDSYIEQILKVVMDNNPNYHDTFLPCLLLEESSYSIFADLD
jgi:hypothetical protein